MKGLLLLLIPTLSRAEKEKKDILSIHVTSDIRFRFARTQIISQMTNPTPTYRNIVFHAVLPNTAPVSNFTYLFQIDLTVNARMNKGKKTARAYYMTEIAILAHDLHLRVTCDNITLDGTSYSWDRDYNGTIPGARKYIKNLVRRLIRVSVVFDSRLQIDITNRFHKKSNFLGQDFLNIELGNHQLLSKETDGITGQFVHKTMRLEDITFKDGHLVGHLKSRTGQEMEHGRAQIVHREDPIWRTHRSCWLIKKMGARLFDGPAEYYIVSDLLQTALN